MPSVPAIEPAILAELPAIYALYSGLMGHRRHTCDLGGLLLFAGSLDVEGVRLVRAANIAGAASLSAVPEAADQRNAIRDGVVDFLVTNLDEALRILKNEIRKRNGVAVGVSLGAEQVLAEMRQRGVLPDLLRTADREFERNGTRVIQPAAAQPDHGMVIVNPAPSGFEASALELVPEGDEPVRRWVRLSPRYLGPSFRRMRSVPSSSGCADALRKAFPQAVSIPAAVS